MTPHQPPPDAVLTAFGVTSPVERLSGGQGTSFRADPLVLKPATRTDEVAWLGEHLGALQPTDVRIAHPVATRDGRWVVGGWQATRWHPGSERPGQWADVLAAGERFHKAVAHLPRPAFIDRRTDPWSVGDRVAWGEADWRGPEQLEPLLQRLFRALHALDAVPSQLIHGDLGGNVVFAEGLAPAILDLSLYYRPVGFAAAVLVVDALVWEGADRSILELVADVPHIDQLMLRAAIYRLVTTGAASPRNLARLALKVEANRPVVELLVGNAVGDDRDA